MFEKDSLLLLKELDKFIEKKLLMLAHIEPVLLKHITG